jgi:hypothetical protein
MWVSGLSYISATPCIEIHPVDFRAVLASLCPASRFWMLRNQASKLQFSPSHATTKTTVGGEHSPRLFVESDVRIAVCCSSYVYTLLEVSFANHNSLSG